MPSPETNPFPTSDADRHALWEMLVRRDIEAFTRRDWDMVADDFVAAGFLGIDAGRSPNPDSWRLAYTLDDYRAAWLEEAAAARPCRPDLRTALFAATVLRDIDVVGDVALAHKKFDGVVQPVDAAPEVLNWQTLYHCRRLGGRWQITGFTGYMPHPIAGSRRP